LAKHQTALRQEASNGKAMKEIHFYFDFISPYAWLAFKALPQSLEGISHRVHYHPVVFGAMLKHHGQLGPAEMPGKRASHPFNSLSLLRLAVAASDNGEPNRYVVESIFKHVWCTGLEASDAERLEALQLHLLSQAHLSLKDPQSVEVKQLLQQQTQQAIDLGLFGVPSMVVNGQVFWGQDALPMLRAYLQGDAWFESADWLEVGKLPVGIRRTPASK